MTPTARNDKGGNCVKLFHVSLLGFDEFITMKWSMFDVQGHACHSKVSQFMTSQGLKLFL